MSRFLARARAALRPSAFVAAAVALLASALLPASGCTQEEPSEPKCEGGYLTAEGACVPLCDPSKCLDGNVCVENQCRLQCSSHAECIASIQTCEPANDDGGAYVQVCLESGRRSVEATPTQGKLCPFGDGDCAVKACPNGLECDPNACNGKPEECVKDEAACKGKELCNVGICGDGKTACTVTTCAPAECKALTCNGGAEGDATAYCTQTDCTSDAQCGAGFYCGYQRDPHDICGVTCSGGKCSDDGATCGKDSDCQKGNNNLCGKTTEPCVDLAAKPAGFEYEEGPVCLMRRTCLRRDECTPCETNLDCSLGSGDVCVTVGPSKACVPFCSTDANCRADQVCVAAGKSCAKSPRVFCATAEDCPTEGDECVDRSVCLPRSGGCHAETATDSKFCFACVDDLDCGGPDSDFACAELGNGERACLDQAFATTCTKDADCPKSPSGKNGTCLDEQDGVSPSDFVFHRCYFPSKFAGGMLVGYSCFP